MTEYKISIVEVCRSNRVTRPDGKVVHDLIILHWDSADRIIVDFGNILIASVSFLDEAFGALADEHATKEISERVKLVNITAFDKNLANGIYRSRQKQRQAQTSSHASVASPL